MNKTQKTGRPWGTLIIFVVIVAFFIIFFDVQAVVEAILDADWVYLGGAAAILLLGYLIMAERWRYLLANRPTISFTFFITNLSNMAKLVTFIPVQPTRVVFMGENENVSIPQATSSVSISFILDLVMKLISLFCAILIGVAAQSSTTLLIIGFLLIVGIIFGLLLILTNAKKIATKITPWLARIPRISEEQAQGIVNRFLESVAESGSPRRLLVSFLWSFLIWVCMLGFFYLGMLAFHLRFPVERMLVAVMAAYVFINPTQPFIPGTFQVLLATPLYFVLRTDQDAIIAFSIVLHVVLLVIWFSLGAWGLRKLDLKFNTLRQFLTKGIDQIQQARTEKIENDAEA